MFLQFLARITRSDKLTSMWLDSVKKELYSYLLENNNVISVSWSYIDNGFVQYLVRYKQRGKKKVITLEIPLDILIDSLFPDVKLAKMFIYKKFAKYFD